MNAIIRIESTEQLNLDPSMFGDASQVVIEAQWQDGARIHVPACELEFVEAALEADERITKYAVETTDTIEIRDMTSREIRSVAPNTPVLSLVSARDFGSDPSTGIDENDEEFTVPTAVWTGLTVSDLKIKRGGGYVWDPITETWCLSVRVE